VPISFELPSVRVSDTRTSERARFDVRRFCSVESAIIYIAVDVATHSAYCMHIHVLVYLYITPSEPNLCNVEEVALLSRKRTSTVRKCNNRFSDLRELSLAVITVCIPDSCGDCSSRYQESASTLQDESRFVLVGFGPRRNSIFQKRAKWPQRPVPCSSM
jgi:hypothetical protein